ncbi:hypothetical protein BKA69DRAFT_227152 [Paraphysoderma sedebokerense]|nr:hypothetical protein BKA69DRAFT_227152 [Paraphysoderma sedebokerense]
MISQPQPYNPITRLASILAGKVNERSILSLSTYFFDAFHEKSAEYRNGFVNRFHSHSNSKLRSNQFVTGVRKFSGDAKLGLRRVNVTNDAMRHRSRILNNILRFYSNPSSIAISLFEESQRSARSRRFLSRSTFRCNCPSKSEFLVNSPLILTYRNLHTSSPKPSIAVSTAHSSSTTLPKNMNSKSNSTITSSILSKVKSNRKIYNLISLYFLLPLERHLLEIYTDLLKDVRFLLASVSDSNSADFRVETFNPSISNFNNIGSTSFYSSFSTLNFTVSPFPINANSNLMSYTNSPVQMNVGPLTTVSSYEFNAAVLKLLKRIYPSIEFQYGGKFYELMQSQNEFDGFGNGWNSEKERLEYIFGVLSECRRLLDGKTTTIFERGWRRGESRIKKWVGT